MSKLSTHRAINTTPEHSHASPSSPLATPPLNPLTAYLNHLLTISPAPPEMRAFPNHASFVRARVTLHTLDSRWTGGGVNIV
jgi:hypothetical protein